MGQNILGFGGGQYGQRIVSFFKDEPIVAGFVNGFYLIITGFLIQEFYKKKNLIIAFSVIILVAFFLTGERSNSIKALMGLLIFYSVFKEYDFKKKMILFITLLVIFLTLILNSKFLKLRFIDQTYRLFTSDYRYFKHLLFPPPAARLGRTQNDVIRQRLSRLPNNYFPLPWREGIKGRGI